MKLNKPCYVKEKGVKIVYAHTYVSGWKKKGKNALKYKYGNLTFLGAEDIT